MRIIYDALVSSPTGRAFILYNAYTISESGYTIYIIRQWLKWGGEDGIYVLIITGNFPLVFIPEIWVDGWDMNKYSYNINCLITNIYIFLNRTTFSVIRYSNLHDVLLRILTSKRITNKLILLLLRDYARLTIKERKIIWDPPKNRLGIQLQKWPVSS